MEKNLEICSLLDFYGNMLTEKQFDIMDLYYNDDLSLGEIGDRLGISRQGVHDAVKRGEEVLWDYEKKLGLYAHRKEYENELREIKNLALDIFDECKSKNYASEIAKKTVVLLEHIDKKLENYETDENYSE